MMTKPFTRVFQILVPLTNTQDAQTQKPFESTRLGIPVRNTLYCTLTESDLHNGTCKKEEIRWADIMLQMTPPPVR